MIKYNWFGYEWGKVEIIYATTTCPTFIPDTLNISYLSFAEARYFVLESSIPTSKIKLYWEKKDIESEERLFEHYVVGMAPYGGVALWLYGYRKEILIAWMKATENQIERTDFLPYTPSKSLRAICDFYINQDPHVRENLEQNGLPPRDLFDNYMKQFTYRYQVMFGHWDEEKEEWFSEDKVEQAKEAGTVMPELDYIEEALYDGTHDKLHDGGLMKYHEAGKPKKLALQWHIKKSEYSAYFWFEDREIRAVYDHFYGAHPDTKTDFMIRIDSEKNKYELALYRYGLRQPLVIAEKTYQLLVFRNEFECFRSENYTQERGAWIW